MMKMRFFLYFLCGAVWVSCSSAPPQAKKEEASAGKPDQRSGPTTKVDLKENTESISETTLNEAIRAQDDEKVQQAATHLLLQNPSNVKALNALGLFHYKRGHAIVAEYFFSKALQLNVNSSELYNNMGLVQISMKKKREAIQSFRKALELNPNDTIVAANLGSIYLESRDFSKAATVLEMAYGRASRDLRVLNNYAVALAYRGNGKLAESLYQEALKVNPSSKEVLFNYATLQIENLHAYREGLNSLARLRFLGPDETMKSRMISLENKAKAGVK